MVAAPVQLLIISGSMGTGKTTVLYEASDLLSEAGIAVPGGLALVRWAWPSTALVSGPP